MKPELFLSPGVAAVMLMLNMERDPNVRRVLRKAHRDSGRRPRVSWCAFTRKWMVNANGDCHECGSPSSIRSESAFRYLPDAMDYATEIASPVAKVAS